MTITLEQIGAAKPWVAKIVGTDEQHGLKREFLSGFRDFSRSNSVGTRGVKTIYELAEGTIYEINSPASWKRTNRYFALIEDNEIVKIDASRVAELLRIYTGNRAVGGK